MFLSLASLGYSVLRYNIGSEFSYLISCIIGFPIKIELPSLITLSFSSTLPPTVILNSNS